MFKKNSTTFDSVLQEKANSFLTRLREIKASDLAKNEKMNYNILEHMLSTYIDGYKWIMQVYFLKDKHIHFLIDLYFDRLMFYYRIVSRRCHQA